MKITVIYNNYADNGLGDKHKVFEIENEKQLIEMVLWLTGTSMYPNRTPERIVKEVIINGKHFETNKYLNPCDWMSEIKNVKEK